MYCHLDMLHKIDPLVVIICLALAFQSAPDHQENAQALTHSFSDRISKNGRNNGRTTSIIPLLIDADASFRCSSIQNLPFFNTFQSLI
ncbi:hypothetical protein L6452_37443 [Arctium lappa]|uniref:Uncharacterized protein n=1 Tax=Arctium lappa TaxID=4217 RepID=A0ACB8Y2B7_ARCLA|nr:hypothetical protein L6452_37443 [Arctium lappa]